MVLKVCLSVQRSTEANPGCLMDAEVLHSSKAEFYARFVLAKPLLIQEADCLRNATSFTSQSFQSTSPHPHCVPSPQAGSISP